MKILNFTGMIFCFLFIFSFLIAVKCDAQTSFLNEPHPDYRIDTICGDFSNKVINFVPVSTYFTNLSPGNPNYPSKNELLQSVHAINKLYNGNGLFFHLPVLEDSISFINFFQIQLMEKLRFV